MIGELRGAMDRVHREGVGGGGGEKRADTRRDCAGRTKTGPIEEEIEDFKQYTALFYY